MFRPENNPTTEELYNRALSAMQSYHDEEYPVSHSHPELRRELEHTLEQINLQMEEVAQLALSRDVPVEQMEDQHGTKLMTPLLVAKAQVLNALAVM